MMNDVLFTTNLTVERDQYIQSIERGGVREGKCEKQIEIEREK